jgi:hypothetical protein
LRWQGVDSVRVRGENSFEIVVTVGEGFYAALIDGRVCRVAR